MSDVKIVKARSVFGDAVLDEDDSMSVASLAYSKSPDSRNESPTEMDGSRTSHSSSKKSSSDSLDISTDSSAAASGSTAPSARRTFTGMPFGKIIRTTEKEKENAPSSWSTNSLPSPIMAAPKPTPKQQRPVYQRFDKDRVKKTQAAIQQASASIRAANSINPTINAARKAKKEVNRLKHRQTQQLRKEWEMDKEDAESFNKQAEQQRLRILHLKQTMSSQHSRNKARQEQNSRAQQLHDIDQESQFKSEVYRDHQQALRAEQANRRRNSVAAKARLRDNHKLGKETLRLQQIEEDEILYEERHEAIRMNMNAKQEYAENRRMSFAFRNGDARRIRMMHADMEAKRMEEEAKSIQLKLAAEMDADAEKRRMEQERRNSLAGRNEYARKVREEEQQRQSQAMAAEHEYFETKWEAENDAREYERSLEEQRRQSLAGRNEYARSVREQELQERSLQLAREQDSYELKWEADRDAKDYLAQVEQQRRDDIAYSLKEARRRREFAKEQQSQAHAAEADSYELKFQGERDAEDYRRQLDADRRASVAQRNEYAREQRLQEELRQSENAAAEHDSYELKWAAERDVELYKRQLESDRRESLAWRNKEAARHAEVMKELGSIALEKERESLVAKWAGEENAKLYLASLAEERRKSLQQRGEQSQHHRQVERDIRDKELQQQEEDEELKSGAQKDVEEYKRRCAARDRTSLQYRGKEAHVRRIIDKEHQLQEYQMEHANFELETEARHDVEEYVRECKQRRRMSLAYRAKEKSNHFKYRSQQADQAREAYSREVRARRADQRSAELARREERAKRALEAIQHSGCSFNPFSSVL